MHIVLEGNIGVGKSSLLNYLKSNLEQVEAAPEPVSTWTSCNGTNILGLFNTDMEKYGLTFQSVVIGSLFERDAEYKNSANPVVFERSIDSSKNVFAKVLEKQGFLDWDGENILKYYYDVYQKFLSPPDLVIYLKVSPGTVYERIKQRGRSMGSP